MYAALLAADTERDWGFGKVHFLNIQKRHGHLMYDTVEKMADSEGSGIELIDRERPSYINCAQGKQTQEFTVQERYQVSFPY